MQKDILIIGCNGYVSAVHANTGQELWRTKLRDGMLGGSRGSDVSVLIEVRMELCVEHIHFF